MTHLLEVKDLITRFYTEEGTIHAVNGISYTLDRGETMALVGESGCGKSVSALSLLGLVPNPPGKVEGGSVLFEGNNLTQLPERDLRHIRGREIAMIFQDPMTSLNPVRTIGSQMAEGLKLHLGLGDKDARQRTIEMLNLVGIPDAANRLKDYPHQFSGGQRQRIMIAMALSCNPAVLIADEPTTALDVTIQAQIVSLVKNLREKLGMAVLWITHDMGVVAGLVDKVAVMYAGFIVEMAPVRALYKATAHPYTLGLLESLPTIDNHENQRLIPIEGTPPNGHVKPTHCPFAERCRFAVEQCWQENPPLIPVGTHHTAACWRWDVVQSGYVETKNDE
ncbi:MAG: ABC transporter ATP-binding protein [Ardenticatenaceae bacterium]|nr:ABC transporter ATP-binding protein [Anaerolineales bacterium]MCB8921969.1 ABC transporter ATP-binding protein [Ardenticatenaceae bacterium]MCB8989545.1 ABC transporter ATP-binding protein [Ardenticatenaceae bacterium]MCB9003088.1 ABC transporter ATP-binding protein [Ardenticatenaceae bacterium]